MGDFGGERLARAGEKSARVVKRARRAGSRVRASAFPEVTLAVDKGAGERAETVASIDGPASIGVAQEALERARDGIIKNRQRRPGVDDHVRDRKSVV